MLFIFSPSLSYVNSQGWLGGCLRYGEEFRAGWKRTVISWISLRGRLMFSDPMNNDRKCKTKGHIHCPKSITWVHQHTMTVCLEQLGPKRGAHVSTVEDLKMWRWDTGWVQQCTPLTLLCAFSISWTERQDRKVKKCHQRHSKAWLIPDQETCRPWLYTAREESPSLLIPDITQSHGSSKGMVGTLGPHQPVATWILLNFGICTAQQENLVMQIYKIVLWDIVWVWL